MSLLNIDVGKFTSDFPEKLRMFCLPLLAELRVLGLMQHIQFIDHACYRVADLKQYQILKSKFAELGELLTEANVNGRPIATFKLFHPVQIDSSISIPLIEPAFEFKDALIQHLCKDGRMHKTKFAKRDQFAPEIIYFSNCIIENKEPEPSGEEGLADLKVIDACYESIRSRQIVTLPRADLKNQPSIDQDIRKPPVGRIRSVHASSPAAS